MNNPYKIIYELRETIAELSERCREQEADIEELLKEHEWCREWISVKYRLPEPFENVLTYDGDGRMLINWRPDEDDKAEEDVYFARGNSVTYWMPLPEPPESEDEYHEKVQGIHQV